ncbi:nitroreductase family protein [Thermodesulfobacteriota bacterium]
MIEDLVRKARSCRRFIEEPITEELLRNLVELARLSASAANRQPLKYALSHRKEMNDLIFPKLKWAAYLPDWQGPEEGERPSAYIIVMGDTEISKSFGCDHGIATQNIVLGATSLGLGCCIIGAVDRISLREELKIPDRLEILHLIALGKPGEKIVIEKMGPEGDIKYWHDESGVHHVPKRALEDIILPVGIQM